MSKKSIVFSTVYPKDIHIQNSLANTLRLIDEYQEGFNDKYELTVIAGSAYPEVVEEVNRELQNLYPCVWRRSSIIHCPFELTEQMTERRGHEISFNKQYLFRQIIKNKPDILCSIDSDMYIPFKHIARYIDKVIKRPKLFVQFPYVLRKTLKSSMDQFGAYLISKECLKKRYASVIYETQVMENGKCRRRGAPDCRLLRALLSDKYKRVRPEDILCLHYDKEEILKYSNGKCFKLENKK